MLAGFHPTTDGAAVALGHHGLISAQNDPLLGGAHGTKTSSSPMAMGRHGTYIADANSGLSREEHNLRDHRSQNPHAAVVPHTDVGGRPTQQASHSLGYTGAHEQCSTYKQRVAHLVNSTV